MFVSEARACRDSRRPGAFVVRANCMKGTDLSDENQKAEKFSDFPFRDEIRKDIEAAGFETPTPIQAAVILPALSGKDVIGLAQTGTGKTAAFALPIIERVAHKLELSVLVLAPTRELAQQIAAMFKQLGKASGIRVAVTVGGIPLNEDHKALRSWPNVLVATPGRLIDHIHSRKVHLENIEIFVVDEADRMHDLGFIPQIRRIIEVLPRERQTLMLTATMPDDVERIARRNMRHPVRIQVGRRSTPPERADQQLFLVREDDKPGLLAKLLDKTEGRALVFLRTKTGVNHLARILSSRRYNAVRLHSGRMQSDRDEALAGFREGRYRILIATDIAARGLDIADIEHVVNYDFPRSSEDYVHRIGRTARVEASGRATSFVTRADRRYVVNLETMLGKKLPIHRFGADDGSSRKSADGKREPGKRQRRRRSGRRRSQGKSSASGRPASPGREAP